MGEGFPGLLGFMGEHQCHQTIVLEDAPTLGEDLPHHLFIRELGGFHRAVASRIGHRLHAFIHEPPCEQFRVQIPERALLPDVEVVGQLTILHVVVVRRVHTDQIDSAVGKARHVGGGAVQDDGGR
jgi:hypothetical protein